MIYNIILAIGLLGTTAMAYWVLRNPTRKWSVLTGKMLDFVEATREDTIYPEYPPIKFHYPKVRYEYNFGHSVYESTRVSLHDRDVAVRKGEERYPWSDWEEGKSLKVYVNPRKPNESVLLIEMAPERRLRYKQILIGTYAALIGWYLTVRFFI